MAQTKEGALKISAKKIGITVEQYIANQKAGLKWCIRCQDWHDLSVFGKDSSRGDGLVPSCRDSRNARARAIRIPKPPLQRGRSFVPARDNDKKQARRRINYFVEAGLIPPPNDIPCNDCGRVWREGDIRHEYDHYLGYEAKHHELVQAVCSKCHHERERTKS